MFIKRYSIASLVFIGFVGWYVTTFISNEEIQVNIFGIVISSISVSIWVMIPLVILYIASVIHMSVYSVVGSFKLRKYEKDYETIIDAIIDAYLGKEDRNHLFKTKKYKLLGTLLDHTKLSPKDVLAIHIEDEKVQKTLELIENIQNGQVEDLKKLSLPINNYLAMQNNRNRYTSGELSEDEILKNSDSYDDELVTKAYTTYVQTASLANIQKYKQYMTKESLFNMLERVDIEASTLDISNEDLIELFALLDLKRQDYIKISATVGCCMIPEQRIKLFEILSDKNDEAMDGYLFTLFDLEMIEQAAAILDLSQENEYLNFKAYRALKESDKNFPINLFI